MEAKERMKMVLDYLGISGLALTKELQLNPNTVKQVTGGYKQRIDEELANAIVSKYNQFNKLWLLTGDGEMLTQKKSDNDITIIATQQDATVELMRQELKLMRQELAMMRHQLAQMNKQNNGSTYPSGIASEPQSTT